MDLKQIKELMAAMEKAGIKKISLKEKTGFEIHLERQDEHAIPVHPVAHLPPVHHPVCKTPEILHSQAAHVQKEEGKYITSPMVGTFYASPSPDHPPFIKVGDKVEAGTVVCIIEAMKVMNEVKANMSGTIKEVCLENGHPVEFGTKLFQIV